MGAGVFARNVQAPAFRDPRKTHRGEFDAMAGELNAKVSMAVHYQ
jgi:hypothetical protein